MSNYVELDQTPDCKLFGSLVCHVKGVHWGWKSNSTLELVDDQNWTIMISGCHEETLSSTQKGSAVANEVFIKSWWRCLEHLFSTSLHKSQTRIVWKWLGKCVNMCVYIWYVLYLKKHHIVVHAWISYNTISWYMINELRHTAQAPAACKVFKSPWKESNCMELRVRVRVLAEKKWGQHFEKEDTGWSIAASDWPGKIWNDYICNNDISCVPGSQEHKSKSYVYTKEGQKRGSEVWMCHSLGSAQRIARAWPGTCSLNLPLLQCYKGCISRRCTFFNGIRVFQGVAATAVIYTMLSIRFLSMHLSNHKTLGHSTYSSSSTGGRLEP